MTEEKTMQAKLGAKHKHILIYLICLALSSIIFGGEASTEKRDAKEAVSLSVSTGNFLFVGLQASSKPMDDERFLVKPFVAAYISKAAKPKQDKKVVVNLEISSVKNDGTPFAPEWITKITKVSTTRETGKDIDAAIQSQGSIPFQVPKKEGETAMGLKKLVVPLGIEGLTFILVPFAHASDGNSRSLIVVIADDLKKMKDLLHVDRKFNPRFEWSRKWFNPE